MILRTFLRTALALVFASGVALAQAPATGPRPVVHGEPAVAPKIARPAPRLRIPGAAPEHVQLPPVSAAEIAKVRAANVRAAAKRVIIGIVRDAAALAPAASRMRWIAVEGGSAAQVSVTSPDAESMRLAISLAGVPEDVEMVFFGSADPMRLEGIFRAGDAPDRTGPWWSPVTEGDTQTVEFFVPARYDPRTLPLRVTKASHLFAGPSSAFTKRTQDIGTAGSCNVDIQCSPLRTQAAFQDLDASVAQMVFTDGSFTGLCTGSLLNDTDPGSQIPWFFSANHCFDNDTAPYKTAAQMQIVANSLATLWGFEAATCGSLIPNPSWSQLNGGAQLVYNNPQSDVLLVRLNGTPPAGSFYSGWDANAITVGTPVVVVHHPEGDLKKVSQGTVMAFSTPGVGGGFDPFTVVGYGSGTTEPGSSGSGLFTSDGTQYLLRGALWGGLASCSNLSGTDDYSRFDQAFNALAPYLAPSTATPFADFTDLWWNPNESGWGLNVLQHPSNKIFAVWYTYAADGTRTWFVLPDGTWTASNTYTGTLYSTAGPAFSNPTFDPSLVRRMPVGSATLTFSDANNGTFAFTVNGVSGVKTIQRQPY